MVASASKKNKSTGNGEEKPSAKDAFPLFFKDPHPISRDRHAEAGLSREGNFLFAAHTNSLPLNVVEFMEAARSYPIVFTPGDKPIPLALVGVREKNIFVDGAGFWLKYTYIPAYVRKYPFIFMEIPEQKQWVLCVDEAAPHFVDEDPAQPFFDGEKPQKICDEALKFCQHYQQQLDLTRHFTQALREQGLLRQEALQLSLPNKDSIRLEGFQVLDEEKYRNLPDAVVTDWFRRGFLPACDAVLLSYSNWKHLASLSRDTEGAAA